MEDIAKDLGQGLHKLETMQREATRQLARTWDDVTNIQTILQSCGDEIGMDHIRYLACS